MRRRVVITGIGTINPLSQDVETLWSKLKEGESGVGFTSIFDASNFPTKISAEVRDWDLDQVGEDPQRWTQQGRHTRFAIGAARIAVEASGIMDGTLDPTRLGVYLGSGEGNQDFHAFTQMVTSALTEDQIDLSRFTKTGLEIQLSMAVK